jgi:putative copper export protein
MQVTLWIGCLGALVLAGVSNWAERRRARRANIDAVGFMPWPLIMLLALLFSAICAALALHRG